MTTIITPWEVVRFGPVRKDYPTAYVCDHIKRRELKLFSKCYLGKDFYEVLLNDMTPLSEASLYSVETTYQSDDLINYEGCLLISLKDDNTTHPDDDSEIDPAWQLAPKFETPCYQELWETHLRYWLSLEVLFTSIRYATFQAGAKGLVRIIEDDIQTVTNKDFSDYKKELKHDADDELENMWEWLKDKYEEADSACDLSTVTGLEAACTSCASPAKKRRRRFYFKN